MEFINYQKLIPEHGNGILFHNKPFLQYECVNSSVGWKHIITDTPTIFKLITKGQFKKSKCKEIYYAVWNRKDILPAIMEILFLPLLIIKR